MENTRSRTLAGVLTYTDGLTDETVLPMHNVFFEDDFLGAGSKAFPTAATAGTSWGKKLVQTAGTPSVAAVANAGSGVAKVALDATSEGQDAVLYFLDQLGFDASKVGGFEARVQLPVIPSGAGVQAVVGLMSSWIAGPDNNTEYLRFGFRASGAILCETQDGTTQSSNAPTSGLVVATATEWHILRINWDNPANVRFWIDGSDVTPLNSGATIPFAATGAAAILQPYVAVYKPSGTGVASLAVDYVRTWTQRQ